MTAHSPTGGLLRWALRGVPVLLLVTVVASFAVLAPRFLTANNLFGVLSQSGWLIVVALGVNFVLLSGGIDLSAGTVMYLSVVVAGLSIANGDALSSLLVAAVTGASLGALNGLLVVTLRIPAFIVTLSTAFIGRGLALYLSSTRMVFAGGAVADLGRRQGLLSPSVAMTLLALLAGWLLLYGVPFGRYVLAVGANPDGARRAGVPTKPIVASVYGLSGLFAGVGGFISISQTSAASANFGQNAEFLAIAAAVLGGTSLFGGRGSLWAPLIGALLIMTVQNGLAMINADPYAYATVTGGVIFLAALIDSVRLLILDRLGRQRT